jgi:uncharacterized protein YbaP (TraB family)
MVAVFFALSNSVSQADPGDHLLPLWQVDGAENRVYLLGSIHLLRENDYPLSPVIYDVYRDAEVLYMELDMDDADPVADQMLANELGLIQGDQSLRDILGAALFAKAESMAEQSQIPLQLLEKTEPWYAAMQVELIMLMRIGFNPAYGIESHLAQMAAADDKEIFGFETVRQQLEFLDNLSAESQQEMLMQTLAESSNLGELMDTLIAAWHIGDNGFLEENLLSDMQELPELNQTIVVDRNLNWAGTIEQLLTHTDDYLIIVGALHLVGEDGVPGLLQRNGFEVTQMRQPAN